MWRPLVRRMICWAHVLLLPSVCAASQPLEPYLVLGQAVELYDGTQRVDLKLTPGDVVQARSDGLHGVWLSVTLGQRVLQAKADGFGRLTDLEIAYAQRSAEIERQVGEISRQVDVLAETIWQLYAADHSIRLDSTIQYRYRQAAPELPDGHGIYPPAVRLQVPFVDRYEDKIPVSRARDIAGRWECERRKLEERLDSLCAQRRDRICDRVGVDAQLSYVRGRFAAFSIETGGSAGEPYVCTKDRTELYQDTRLASELAAGAVVIASVSRDDGQWLRVRWNGQVLSGRRDNFQSRLEVENRVGRRAAWLDRAIQDRTEAVDRLIARRLLLESNRLLSDYSSRLDSVALGPKPRTAVPWVQPYYLSSECPRNAVEVVNRTRARAYIHLCEKEIEAISEHVQEADTDLRAWRREWAALGPRLADLRHRMDTVR